MKRKASADDDTRASKVGKRTSNSQEKAIKKGVQMYQECEAVMNRLLSLRRELSSNKSKQAKNVMHQIDRFEDEWVNIVIKSRAKESAQLQEIQNAQRLRIGGFKIVL